MPVTCIPSPPSRTLPPGHLKGFAAPAQLYPQSMDRWIGADPSRPLKRKFAQRGPRFWFKGKAKWFPEEQTVEALHESAINKRKLKPFTVLPCDIPTFVWVHFLGGNLASLVSLPGWSLLDASAKGVLKQDAYREPGNCLSAMRRLFCWFVALCWGNPG